MIETAIIYIKRNKIKSLIIILIIATIILGEIIGLLLSNASEKSERDAYLYNGAALVIEDDNGGFTKSDYDEIRKVKYVTGLGAWRELIADPVDTENVKEHKGIDPENKDVSNRADKMVIVANMDVQQYSLFSWEKNVSLIEGEFPTYKNKGIIVEQRYAKKNNLKVGDEVKYTIGDQSEVTSLQICGIYKVDSDFEIYDSNEEGTSVYIHSPYNSIYVDYDYIVELLGLEYTASTGSEVYIDKIEHIDAVKTQLKKMYGDNVEIYDNTSNYLDSECKVVGLMGKTSKIIPAGISGKGAINKRDTNGVEQEEFEVLQKYIGKIIKEIGKEILQGKIDLKPTNYKGKTPCRYCEYHAICGFDARNNKNKYNQ